MICRDPAFWRPVCEHPDVKPRVDHGGEGDWLPGLLESPLCLPFRGEHGGYFLVRSDHLGRVWDLHAAFAPEGWGRDANRTLKALLGSLGAWDVITVHEVAGNWRSRPPKSFGFRVAADFRGELRTWVLTRAAWEASPAHRRME